MKKYIWISLLLIISCGARKSNVEKLSQKTEATAVQNLSKEVESTSSSENGFNFSNLAENEIFSIAGGLPYTLNYSGIVYSGSSSIEISKNKAETKYNYFNRIITTYKTVTNYQTLTTYKSILDTKSKSTEKEAYPIWVWMILGSVITIALIIAWKSFKGSNAYLSLLSKFRSGI